MRPFTIAFIIALLTATFLSDSAEARRRGFFLFPIPGTAEQLVKVKDLPDIPALRRKDGKYVDLGYKFNRFYGGEWVGYIDSKRYLKLNDEQLKILLTLGGLRKLPPVPEKPGFFGSGSGRGKDDDKGKSSNAENGGGALKYSFLALFSVPLFFLLGIVMFFRVMRNLLGGFVSGTTRTAIEVGKSVNSRILQKGDEPTLDLEAIERKIIRMANEKKAAPQAMASHAFNTVPSGGAARRASGSASGRPAFGRASASRRPVFGKRGR